MGKLRYILILLLFLFISCASNKYMIRIKEQVNYDCETECECKFIATNKKDVYQFRDSCDAYQMLQIIKKKKFKKIVIKFCIVRKFLYICNNQ